MYVLSPMWWGIFMSSVSAARTPTYQLFLTDEGQCIVAETFVFKPLETIDWSC